MNRTIAMGLALAMTVGTMYADKLPIPDKKQRKQDIQHLIDWSNDTTRTPTLQMWKNSNFCFAYCMDARK